MPKIVILTSRFPFPLEKGDKLRIFNQIKSLSEKNEVHLICLNNKNVTAAHRRELESFCKSQHCFVVSSFRQALNLFRSLFQDIPLQVGLYYSASVHRKITR